MQGFLGVLRLNQLPGPFLSRLGKPNKKEPYYNPHIYRKQHVLTLRFRASFTPFQNSSFALIFLWVDRACRFWSATM
jgi:hypothetical protein